jgi:hypothetical protein
VNLSIKQYLRALYIKKGFGLKIFLIENKRYYKVSYTLYGSNAIHCFIEKNTGNIYKPKTYVAPDLNSCKYNIFFNFNSLLNDCEISGKYLA